RRVRRGGRAGAGNAGGRRARDGGRLGARVRRRRERARRVGGQAVRSEVGGSPVLGGAVDEQADAAGADELGLRLEVLRAELAEGGERAPPARLEGGRVHAVAVLAQQAQVGVGEGKAVGAVTGNPVAAVLARAGLQVAGDDQVLSLLVGPAAAEEQAAGD